MWKTFPHIGMKDRMKSESELTLMILECYLRYGPCLSMTDIYAKTRISKKRIGYILSVLEKRGYLTKDKNSAKYVLSKKIAMWV